MEKANKLPKWLTTVTPFSKYLAMFLFILFPFVGFYLGMQYQQKVTTVRMPTPTPNQTAGWQTYTNSDHSLEFKYPPNFSPINVNDNKLMAAFMDKSNTKQRLSTSPDISLRTFSITPQGDYKGELIKDVVFAGSGLHPKSFTEFSSKTIGNNTVYYIETGLFEGVLSLNYYLVYKNQVAAFTTVSSPVDWTNPSFKPENDPLSQSLFQILSTFRFTN
jgi:hypothetical protein